MKKLKWRQFDIDIPVFKNKVRVIISKDINRAVKSIHQWFGDEFKEWDAYSADGKTISREGNWPVIWMREPPNNPYNAYWLSVLHHEANHATARILDRIKTPINYDTEETFNYISEYIFHEILKRNK